MPVASRAGKRPQQDAEGQVAWRGPDDRAWQHRPPAQRAPRESLKMGNRVSKVYTRTGDDGSTGLGDGTRTRKDSARVEAYGTIDELNSTLGVVLACADVPDDVRDLLMRIQHALFDLGGELCVPGMETIHAADVTGLEQTLDHYNAGLPRLKEFILPGGSMAAAHCHIARTVCRRAERRVVTLARAEPVRAEVVHYLNRLSDLLFVLCRVLSRADGKGEVLWQHEKRPKPKPQA